MTLPWLSILGIGEDGLEGLSPVARRLLDAAEVLVGGERHLAMVPADGRRRIAWPSPLSALVDEIVRMRGTPVAVLATGDPMHYGIGVTLARAVPAEETIVLPGLSAFSLAAARLGWPLAEVRTMTLHGRPVELLNAVLQPGARLLVLSHDAATPARVAALLAAQGYGASRIAVLEHMGGPSERRLDGTAATWNHPAGADFNTIAIELAAAGPVAAGGPAPGLPDEMFLNDGQLTKREVRAATLAVLRPGPGQLLWDIGAGSGSIAIEWMRADPLARAVAVERAPARLANIAGNAAALGVPGLRIVAGTAPDALADLDGRPDAVFIGGGISAPGLVEHCWNRLKPGGRLVANVVTLEGEAALIRAREGYGGQLTRIAVSRAEPVGPYHGWRPLMTVTQWAIAKPHGEA